MNSSLGDVRLLTPDAATHRRSQSQLSRPQLAEPDNASTSAGTRSHRRYAPKLITNGLRSSRELCDRPENARVILSEATGTSPVAADGDKACGPACQARSHGRITSPAFHETQEQARLPQGLVVVRAKARARHELRRVSSGSPAAEVRQRSLCSRSAEKRAVKAHA